MSVDAHPAGDLPVLTEVLDLEPERPAPGIQQELVRALPGMVRDALNQIQPELEQHLLDALMPKLLAAVSGWQAGDGNQPAADVSRLP